MHKHHLILQKEEGDSEHDTSEEAGEGSGVASSSAGMNIVDDANIADLETQSDARNNRLLRDRNHKFDARVARAGKTYGIMQHDRGYRREIIKTANSINYNWATDAADNRKYLPTMLVK